MAERPRHKAELGTFLAGNPFPGPFSDGLFFRDKMRALHRIAPDVPAGSILEVGGGQSGLTSMLYPPAQVTNLDLNPGYASAAPNRRANMRFVAGDAREMPFSDASFDIVTMFDILEHVEEDRLVVAEATRVLRPGGWILVSTPDRERWRYPYYRIFRPIARDEAELFAEWGHVRRGYTLAELEALFGRSAERRAAFINPLLAFSHDVTFSRLGRRKRKVLHALLAPLSLAGWLMQSADTRGTEIAAAWQIP